MSPEPLQSFSLKQSVLDTASLLRGEPDGGIVRPWVHARLDRDTSAVCEFVQYGTEFEFRSDEAVSRGGAGSAPSPLRYLLSAIAFCTLGWCSKTWSLADAAVHALSIDVRTMMDMRGEHLIDATAAYPQWFVLHVVVKDDADDATAVRLLREAVQRCPVSALVVEAVPVHLMLEHNGVTVLDERPDALRDEHRQEQTL